MEEVLDKDLAKEVLTILPYLDDVFVNTLPGDLIAQLTNLAADSTKDFYIQKGKKLNEQNLSEECKSYLALLYYEFASPLEQDVLLASWIKNDAEIDNSDI